ncbi:SGNH hydrolase, partial [Melanomma pulvis-pyrius CBS 109.77]
MRQSLAVAQGLFAALVTCAPAVSRWPNPFLRRQDDDFDEYDLSYIKKVAAIGDSYSAGIGAGNKLGGWGSRYDASHPVLVSNYLTGLSEPLQFHSCSGHTIPEVLEGQMWRVGGGQDAIMISAGGNDAELVDILNQCVYQFFSPTNLLEWLAGKTPEKIINDPAFTANIQKLIDEAKLKLNPDGAIYYTGYAKFWDEKMEDLDWCAVPDHAWSMFPFLTAADHLGLDWQPKATLTVARRKKMNDLVDLVNGKIVDVVKNSGTNVFFVDYDRYFGEVGGRFCAPDIQEPKSDNDRLSFFE